MAYFSGSIYSKALDMDTHVSFVLPYDKPAENQKKPCKVLYLLHGISNNSDSWVRMTSVERYARKYGFALVFPEVQRSFYTDMEKGLAYFTYVAEELPAFFSENFAISNARKDTFIAGLSMGGYGALKVALSKPETFGACASFSGAVDLLALKQEMMKSTSALQIAEMKAIFGDDLEIKPDNDLFYLLNKVASLPIEERPKIMVTCGTEDFLYEHNQHFKHVAEALPVDFIYEEWEGTHEWNFWDQSVEKALYFFNKGRI